MGGLPLRDIGAMAVRVHRSGGGVSVHLRLTPKGGRDAVEGWTTGADGTDYLKARVRAVPEDGKANKAVRVALASAMGVPQGTIEIVSGATSREKTVLVSGDAIALIARLERLRNHCAR